VYKVPYSPPPIPTPGWNDFKTICEAFQNINREEKEGKGGEREDKR